MSRPLPDLSNYHRSLNNRARQIKEEMDKFLSAGSPENFKPRVFWLHAKDHASIKRLLIESGHDAGRGFKYKSIPVKPT